MFNLCSCDCYGADIFKYLIVNLCIAFLGKMWQADIYLLIFPQNEIYYINTSSLKSQSALFTQYSTL